MKITRNYRYILIFAVTIFALSACVILPTSEISAATEIPPTPRAYVTHAPAKSVKQPISLVETQSSMDLSVKPTSLPDSLAELARQVHGDRLVDWIEIPTLNILAPVTPVGWQPVANALDENYPVKWDSPDAVVGWAVSSALPGENGNILLYGHNNIHASIFLKLSEIKPGDKIFLRTKEREWVYRVMETKILPVLTTEQDFKAYQDFFQQTVDERLTLLSCWPPTGNTHRVIVTAFPD